jgi:hypothetical protein
VQRTRQKSHSIFSPQIRKNSPGAMFHEDCKLLAAEHLSDELHLLEAARFDKCLQEYPEGCARGFN